jgi:hypothetical protein
MGHAYNGGSIYSASRGALAGGAANAQGADTALDPGAEIFATARGALAWGYCRKSAGNTATAYMKSTALGAWAGGYVDGPSEASTYILGSGVGAFAHGSADDDATIRATNIGSHGFGSAFNGGDIVSSGYGSFAAGGANNGGIFATGAGSIAMGRARNTYGIYSYGRGSVAMGDAYSADIRAGANGAMQFGQGTNLTADTVQVGAAGLRLKQTVGAPGVLQNGDIWVANNYVYIRSNGVSCKCVNANM